MAVSPPASIYQEFAPSAALAPRIECIWTFRAAAAATQTILPDGCIDLILRTPRAGCPDFELVGAMTRAQPVQTAAGDAFIGIRFRPGGAADLLLSCDTPFADRKLPFAAIHATRAARFAAQLARAEHPPELLALVENHLAPADHPADRVQRALDHFVAHHGTRPLDELHELAGLGPRQFRRVCLARTGLAPRLLGRILRFRRVAAELQAATAPDLAALALDYGYSDQAHFSHEFREFAGTSPKRYRLSGEA